MKTFWIGERPGSKWYPAPQPKNRTEQELLISNDRVFTVSGEIDYVLEEDGKYGAATFSVFAQKKRQGHCYLHFDTLLLLAEYPDQVVETNRWDEHFFYRLLKKEEWITIQHWGSQGCNEITVREEEFAKVIAWLKELPEGAGERENYQAPLSRPALVSDRPDWCEECGHVEAECECLCYRCEKEQRFCLCPKNIFRQPVWKSKQPLRFEGNRFLYHYILSEDYPVYTAEVCNVYGEDNWRKSRIILKDYQKAQKQDEIAVQVGCLEQAKIICSETYGELEIPLVDEPEQLCVVWSSVGVVLQSNFIATEESGSIHLPWDVWNVLMDAIPFFEEKGEKK